MTEQEHDEALADLRQKIKTLTADLEAMAMARLDKLDKAGTGIVQDHAENGCNYRTPRNFMAAFGKDITAQIGQLPPKGGDDRMQAEHYWIFM